VSLSDLAAIGSFVSGVAIVVTLVLLLMQMRQANKNQRSLMQQGRTARVSETILRCTEPFLSEAMVRGFRSDVTMEPSQIQSFLRQLSALVYNYEDSFLQHRAGTLDSPSWDTDVAALREFFSYPGFRVAWRFNRDFMSGAFREFVDTIMRETEGTKRLDLASIWITLLAEETAQSA
jgi:hypothetical protein